MNPSKFKRHLILILINIWVLEQNQNPCGRSLIVFRAKCTQSDLLHWFPLTLPPSLNLPHITHPTSQEAFCIFAFSKNIILFP